MKTSEDFDGILKIVGPNGRYQIWIAVLIGFSSVELGAQTLGAVFTAGVPNFRCIPSETTDANVTVDEGNCEYTVNGRSVKCTQWDYSEDVYESSIVTKVSVLTWISLN